MSITACILALSTALPGMAQVTETEPNDGPSDANPVPMGVAVAGITCAWPEQDYFRIIVPMDGVLRVATSVSASTSTPVPGGFELQVPTDGAGTFGAAIPAVGANDVPEPDTLYFTCMQADTFFIRMAATVNNISYCYTYTFTADLLPALYVVEPEPNDVPGQAIPLAPGTSMEGHLGFKDESSTGNGQDPMDYYSCTAADDGTIRVIVEMENAGVAVSPVLIELFDASGGGAIGSQPMALGNLGVAASDTFLYDCIPAGIFYIRTLLNNATDCGISYRLRYELLPMAYTNDLEPNNAPEQAVLVDLGDAAEGHLRVNNDLYDYYKVYKADTGYLKIPWSAGLATGGTSDIQLFVAGENSGYAANYTAAIGTDGALAMDTAYFLPPAPDTVSIRVHFTTSNFCGSYRLGFQFLSNVGVEENPWAASIALFPVPAQDRVTVRYDDPRMDRLLLYDARGRAVRSLDLFVGPSSITIDVSDLMNGVYHMRFLSPNGAVHRRLVIAR